MPPVSEYFILNKTVSIGLRNVLGMVTLLQVVFLRVCRKVSKHRLYRDVSFWMAFMNRSCFHGF